MADNRTDLQDAAKFLAIRLVDDAEPAVFLLGAGCSMQYGLPGFRQLLTYLGADLRLPAFAPDLKLEDIRTQIEKSWTHGKTPENRRRMIARYVDRVHGDRCPAYRRLARLAGEGHVKAFINMNFDCLLEEALKEERVPYRTASSFVPFRSGEIAVYKPHGSTGRLDAFRGEMDVILDIAKSDLFVEKDRAFVRKLLSNSD